jgi:hypothetical protein
MLDLETKKRCPIIEGASVCDRLAVIGLHGLPEMVDVCALHAAELAADLLADISNFNRLAHAVEGS